MEIKKISKRFLYMALAVCAISFASCGSSSGGDDDTPTPTPPPPVTSEKQLPHKITRVHTPDGVANPTETETDQYSYDSENRVTQISSSLNLPNSLSYYSRTISYTAEGRVERVVWTPSAANAEVVTYNYTYNGNDIEVKTNDNVLVEKIQIDSNGRVIRREQPADTGRSTYIIEPTSTIISYRYDGSGNITTETYESSNYIASYVYDASKKGIFAEVKTPQWLLVTLDIMVTSFSNPATQKSEAETGGATTVAGDYAYTFNADNYPTEETYTSQRASNKFKSVVTVEYIKAN